MATLLDSIYGLYLDYQYRRSEADNRTGLLLQPEFSDPVNTTTTLGFHHDEVEFADEVREHVEQYAMRSRESWKQLLMEGRNDGDDEIDNEDDGEGVDDDGFEFEFEDKEIDDFEGEDSLYD
jgi:hypothetical protein